MLRIDPHRPSAIEPLDYEYVGIENDKIDDVVGGAWLLAEHRRIIREHQTRTGGTYSRHRHGGNCHVCGAHCVYSVLFHHAKTNTYIRVGFDCAAKLDMGDPRDFRNYRTACKAALELKAGKTKAAVILADAGLARAWELYDAATDALQTIGAYVPPAEGSGRDYGYKTRDYATLCDVIGKLVKYGGISEKQTALVARLVDRIDNRKRIEAERAAEKAATAPCPTGRQTVTGEVLKTDYHVTRYGETLKMTVKTDAGYLVWGSVPSSLALVDVGQSEGDRAAGATAGR